jgi:hypothetical protein
VSSSSVQSGWPVTHRISSIHGYDVSCIQNVQSNITVAISFPSHTPYCTHGSLFLVAISFLFHTLLTAMYTQASLPCCHLISASLSPYSNVYIDHSSLLPSHSCFTLSLQQCIYRSVFLVAISFVLHTLLTAMYTQASLSCYGLLSVSKTPLLLFFFNSRPVLTAVLFLFSMTVHAIPNPEAINLSMHMTAP